MLLAVGAFGVFAALPQRTLHGFDSDFYAALLDAGTQPVSTAHVAYLPVCRLLLALVSPVGGGPVQAMWLAAALGSALGVFCLHRAARLLVDDGAALLVPVAVALTPACFYFATAAEIHGVFAAGSGAAWWAFARWRMRPSVARAAMLGATCGAAATVHAFGHVLAPMFVGIAVVQRTVPWRQLVATALVVAATHAAAALALAAGIGHGAGGQTGAATSMLAVWWRAVPLASLLAVAWRECLLPYLPWSALAVVAIANARSRPWGLAWLVAMALHAPIACVFLANDGQHYWERGGYLLPTAMPAVLAGAVLLRGRRAWLAVAIGGAITASFVAPRWRPLYGPEFVAAVAALQREAPVAFLVAPDEIEGVRTHLRGVVAAEVVRSLESYYGLAATPATAMPLPPWFDAMLQLLGGERDWIVTAAAVQCLADSPAPAARCLWQQHVLVTYEVEALRRPGLEAFRLRRRR